MLNDRVPLLGVNTTLKRVAEKLEFTWHGLRDFDSMSLTADADCMSPRVASDRQNARRTEDITIA